MRYQIPIEAPRGRFAHLAVRATAPYWTALFAGALPGMVWAVANAYFLDCRDKRKQALFGVIAYAVVLAIGGSRFWLYRSGTFDRVFGADGPLIDSIMVTLHFLASLGAIRYLAGRQIDVAHYRRSLGRRLPWGIYAALALILFYYFVIPLIFRVWPDIYWMWGPMLL